MKIPATALALLFSLSVSAQSAPWYMWKSKVTGKEFCAQTSPGEGWELSSGPYRDSKCTISLRANTVAAGNAEENAGEVALGIVNETAPPEELADGVLQSDSRSTGVSMTCGASGTSVRIRASNSSSTNRACESRCFYKTKQGASGTLHCSGTVPMKANDVLFCARSSSTESPYVVTSPGYFSCK
jgi:hypothetical protein